MVKNLLLIITGIMFITPFVSAREQKIGFVESSKIFSQYQATSVASTQFSEYVNACRDSAAKIQLTIQTLKNELDAQRLMLSESARLKKLDEIEMYTQIYNNYLQEVFGPGGKIEQKNEELMAPLLKKINDAIAKIAAQEGFTMVIDLSKDIFYASPELNLTEMVINELNREFGVATVIPGTIKKSIGILPLKEENTEAFNLDLGERCQNELYSAIKSYTHNFNIISRFQINSEFTNKKWDYNQIDETQAYMIGKATLCNYIITGKVSKTANKIDYTITLRDVDRRQEIGSRSNSVTDDIKFSEALNNDLRALLERLTM